MKDHTSIEEAIRLTVSLYVISQNLQNLIFIAQSQFNDQALIKDINTIFQYVTNLNFTDNTIEEKIKRSTAEITKVVTGNS